MRKHNPELQVEMDGIAGRVYSLNIFRHRLRQHNVWRARYRHVHPKNDTTTL